MMADDDTEEGFWRGLSVAAAVHWGGFATDNENEVDCEVTDSVLALGKSMTHGKAVHAL